MTNKITS